jgi:hypothetical protein
MLMNGTTGFNNPAMSGNNAYNTNYGQNGNYLPAVNTASNNPYGSTPNYSTNPSTTAGMGTGGYNNNLVQPPIGSNLNNNGMYNGGLNTMPTGYQNTNPGMNGYPPNTSLMASNIGLPGTSSSINPNQRTIRSDADYAREYGQQSSLNFMFVLFLLASAVANVYLLMQLNHLLQRYRSLQASSRGTNSFAV